jgi:hypothetical protein
MIEYYRQESIILAGKESRKRLRMVSPITPPIPSSPADERRGRGGRKRMEFLGTPVPNAGGLRLPLRNAGPKDLDPTDPVEVKASVLVFVKYWE